MFKGAQYVSFGWKRGGEIEILTVARAFFTGPSRMHSVDEVDIGARTIPVPPVGPKSALHCEQSCDGFPKFAKNQNHFQEKRQTGGVHMFVRQGGRNVVNYLHDNLFAAGAS